jgi:hypothetical protein
VTIDDDEMSDVCSLFLATATDEASPITFVVSIGHTAVS